MRRLCDVAILIVVKSAAARITWSDRHAYGNPGTYCYKRLEKSEVLGHAGALTIEVRIFEVPPIEELLGEFCLRLTSGSGPWSMDCMLSTSVMQGNTCKARVVSAPTSFMQKDMCILSGGWDGQKQGDLARPNDLSSPVHKRL